MPYEETLTLSNRDSNRNVLSGLLSTNRNDWHDHNDRYHRSGQYDPTQKRHEDTRVCERNALAYSFGTVIAKSHVAVALGRDVDKPRNLAKSVTVE